MLVFPLFAQGTWYLWLWVPRLQAGAFGCLGTEKIRECVVVFPVPLVWVEGHAFPTMIDCLSCWECTLFAGLAQQRFPWVLQKGVKDGGCYALVATPCPVYCKREP